MGHIWGHDLDKMIELYGVNIFVETGTFIGEGLEYASNFEFKELYSIEMLYPLCKKAQERFMGVPGIYIYFGSSHRVLSKVLPNIHGNILYWLDAHLPSNHIKGLYDQAEELPLEQELAVICNSRDISKDVFIIDDLRIYEKGEYQNGNWPRRGDFLPVDGAFLNEVFKTTHTVARDYRDEGYLIATPKGEK